MSATGKSTDGKSKSSAQAGSRDSIQYELCLQSGSGKVGQLNRITELENRIKMLESVMGSDQKDKLVRP
jgi:hypothetical protein